MTRYDSDMVVPDGWGFARRMDRREFLKLTGTGLLVMFAVEPLVGPGAGARCRPDARATRPT